MTIAFAPTTDLGGGRQGFVETTYARLLEVFGEPQAQWPDTEKTSTEWHIVFDDGTVAAIYDYWYDIQPMLMTGLYNWHIGGYGPEAVARVTETLGA